MKINFQISESFINGLLHIQRKNWVITVMIFSIVFISAVFIWRDCIFDPQPGETTLNNILKIEEEYKDKMSKIKKNHQILNAQSQRFDNPEKTLENRDYFKPSEVNNPIKNEYTPNSKSFNPQLAP